MIYSFFNVKRKDFGKEVRKMDSKTKAIRMKYSPVSLHGYGVFALPKSYKVVCISSRHTAAKRTEKDVDFPHSA